MWNSPIVGEDRSLPGNMRIPVTFEVPQHLSHVQSFYMKHKILEGKTLTNRSVVCQIHQSFIPPTFPTL